MRAIIIIAMVSLIGGCGTISGTVTGMGEDLQDLGGWIKRDTKK